ncbi:hypothetical protein [Flagellimonas sp.]|uniref:hypothetical protein n=1 Tax=Flagellimonas sp. TaxID=2058762 RepID=UPI003B512DFF
MKIKKYIFGLFPFWVLMMSMVPACAQDVENVPDLPEEIRVLPENFKDDYKDKVYDYVETTSWLSRARRWLLEHIASWFDLGETGAVNFFRVLEFIFYTLIVVGVVYLIVKIILNKEGRWIFKRNKEKENTLSFEIGENIQEVDFDELIKKAVANKDFRAAIRYYYLLLLKKLDQFDVIDFDAQKTSHDYQMEVEGSKYAAGFNKATYYYIYIWYGEFLIDEEEYGTTSGVYRQLLKQFAK